MSFDTYYPNRKDWRAPYRKVDRFSSSCRHGGSCPWCLGNRTIVDKRLKVKAHLEMKVATENV